MVEVDGRPGFVTHSADPEGAWSLHEAAPTEALRGLVIRYAGFTERSQLALRRREMPTPVVTVILNLGTPLSVGIPGEPAEEHANGFLARVSPKPAVTAFIGTSSGIQIDLSPIAAQMLVGFPMHELPEPAVALEHLLGPEVSRLEEEIALTSRWEDRFHRLDAFILRRLAAGSTPTPSTVWAWRQIVASSGRVEIASLASQIACSREHLGRDFRRYVGVTPKTLSGIVRFRRALRLIEASQASQASDAGLARIAADCGYFDQSHMSRDFRRFAGVPPGAVAASRMTDFLGNSEDEINSVQAAGSVAA